MLLFGQSLHGFAGTVLYSIAPSYLDGSVSSAQSPTYLGKIFYVLSYLGFDKSRPRACEQRQNTSDKINITIILLSKSHSHYLTWITAIFRTTSLNNWNNIFFINLNSLGEHKCNSLTLSDLHSLTVTWFIFRLKHICYLNIHVPITN